jgi:hypothetical protein
LGPIVALTHRTFMGLPMHPGCTLQAILGSGAPVLCQFPPLAPRAGPYKGRRADTRKQGERLLTERIEGRTMGRITGVRRGRRGGGARSTPGTSVRWLRRS